jgi:hypothetical protein
MQMILTQVYCHLSPSNHQTVFTELQDCLNDIQKLDGCFKTQIEPRQNQTYYVWFS